MAKAKEIESPPESVDFDEAAELSLKDQAEPETPEEEEPEAEPEAEVEDEKPEAEVEPEAPKEEAEPEAPKAVVPQLIQKYASYLAPHWGEFSSAQREEFLLGIAGQIDQKATSAAAEPSPEGQEKRAIEPQGPTQREQTAPPVQRVPDAETLDDADLQPLIDLLGDADATGALKKLQAKINAVVHHAKYATDRVKQIGDLTISTLDAYSDESQLERALTQHEGEISILYGPHFTDAQQDAVSESAAQIMQKGRVARGNWSDAVSLAILELRNGKKEGRGESEESKGVRRRRARSASSLTTPSRAARDVSMPNPKTIGEAMRQELVSQGLNPDAYGID